jgi:ABC-type cobalamin/Fe3+-siderophores transport system ATPase subunit
MINVTAGYENKPVIKNINLKISRGEKAVMMSPSGSGKSTLLKTAILLVKPWSGMIF